MSVMAVSSAAARLGVSARQVQYLVAQGELQQVARGVVDESSVEQHMVLRGQSHKRAWSEATAWGAISLLSGGGAEGMGDSQRSRLKSRLRKLSAADLVERVRGRAVVGRYRAHSSASRYLRDELVVADYTPGRLGLAEANTIDGYVKASQVDALVRRHGLIRDGNGRVTIRATTIALEIVRDLAQLSVVLAASDLAGSLDVRERRAGLDALDHALAAFRG